MVISSVELKGSRAWVLFMLSEYGDASNIIKDIRNVSHAKENLRLTSRRHL